MIKNAKVYILGLIAILVFSAFGCKQSDSSEEDTSDSQTNNGVQEGVTYNAAELETITADSMEGTTESDEAENDSAVNANNSADSGNGEEKESDTNGENETNSEENTLLTQAEKLAEIYGTYTNKDKESFKNLKDLRQYSTEKLQKWIDKKSAETIDKNAPFYGVTTKALSSTVLKQGTKSTEVLVTVKREEITTSSNTPKTGYKVILMMFVKSGEDWKLDGIYWQD